MRQLELFAKSLRRMARLGDEEIVDGAEFALRLIGPESIAVVDRLACGARLRWTDRGYVIELEDGLPDINFACAHEVAHWALREVARYDGEHEERYANYLGAALLAPRPLVRAGFSFYGRKLEPVEPLAEALSISKTAANLRLGEVANDQRAVVTRTGHVLRSDVDALPEPDRIVVARARTSRETPGLARTSLRGGIDEGRVALRAR